MKKSRLVFCILGVCLSISALLFGVWSTVKRTATIKGSIQYEITTAHVDIQTKIYKATSFVDSEGLEAYITELESAGFGSNITGLAIVGSSQTYSSLPGEENIFNYNPNCLSFSNGENGAYAYFFVVNIVNKSEDVSAWAKVDDSVNGSGITNTITQNSTQKNNIDDNGVNLVLGIALVDEGIKIEGESLNYKINVGSV